MSGYLLAGMLLDKFLHEVLQVKLQLFESMLFYFFLFVEEGLRFQRRHLPGIFRMLVDELAKLLIRLHQVRFDTCF